MFLFVTAVASNTPNLFFTQELKTDFFNHFIYCSNHCILLEFVDMDMDGTISSLPLDFEQLPAILEALPALDTAAVAEILLLPSDVVETCKKPQFDFQVDMLLSQSNSYHHENVLCNLSAEPSNYIIDASRRTNATQYLCVSAFNEDREFLFTANSIIHSHAPIFLEVKSRFESTMNSSSHATEVELQLLEQCLDRITMQIGFRGYLSKFVALASSGHMSLCVFYSFDPSHDNFSTF